MGFGNLSENCQLRSPNVVAHKRPLQLEDEVVCLPEGPLSKMSRVVPREDDCFFSSSGALTPETTYCPSAPSASAWSSDDESTQMQISSCIVDPPSAPSQGRRNGSLESAVGSAMRLYKAAQFSHALEFDRGHADFSTREDRASKHAEAWAAERYDEMKAALFELLPWAGPLQNKNEEGDYDVIEFEGMQPPRGFRAAHSELDEDALLEAQLKILREKGQRECAWEAACALMAAMSSRREKCWLEAHDLLERLESELKSYSGCKSKKSARRNAAIHEILEEAGQRGCGFFAHYLVHGGTRLRVAFSRGLNGPTPASLVVTSRMSLWDALASMDDKGPLRGEAAERKWCLQRGREFAFQVANLGEDEESRKARLEAAKLQPDPRLRSLLRSRKNVVLLEVVAALAPRDVCKRSGLSEIIKAEMARVMRNAKANGDAVVFCLGSDSPHALAEKVYLRKPIGDYGLRCGYLRWRASPSMPWARERVWDERITLCLQMP